MAKSSRKTPEELARSMGLGGTNDQQPKPTEEKPAAPKHEVAIDLEKNEPKVAVEDSKPKAPQKKRARQSAPRRAKPDEKSDAGEGEDPLGNLLPKKMERKTKKCNFLFKPSEFETWNNLAKENGISLTQLIEAVMNDYCSRLK